MDLNFIAQNVQVFVVLAVWDLAWKGFALWKAGRLNQKYWFIALLVINSAGILPIIYLIISGKKKGSFAVAS